jgi:cytochrome P450
VEVAGRQIPAGGRITLHWTSANRDPRVFEAPGEFRWGRNPQDNLLYGAGIHVCPGAALSRMELGVALRALLAAVPQLAPAMQAPEPAHYPAIGFARLPLQLRWA